MRRMVLAVALLSACELVLPIHEDVDGEPDATTDATIDGTAQDAATEAASDPNLIVAPGFDGGGAGCGFPWNPTVLSVTLTEVDAGVCRVCVVKQGGGITQAVNFKDASAGDIHLSYGGFVAAVKPEVSTSVLFQLDVHLRDGGRNFWPQPQLAAGATQTGKQVDLNADNGVNTLSSIGLNVLDEDNVPDGGTSCFDLVAPYLDVSVQ